MNGDCERSSGTIIIAVTVTDQWLKPIGLVLLHASNEPGELSQTQRHDDRTINIVVAITISLLLL